MRSSYAEEDVRRMRKKTRKYLSKKRTILAKAPKEDRAWQRELDKGCAGWRE